MSNDQAPDDPAPAVRPAYAAAPSEGAGRKRRALDGRTIGGRYRITQTVAAGANTLIADAVDTELDREVTIKLVRPELSESEAFRRRFRQQMEAMAELSHPNVAAVYDWGEERIGKRATVYVVGEYLAGGSLRDLFDRKRTLTPSQALMVGLEACRGLDFAHRKGLVHTELTPSKLVFGDDRRLRIVDFGLARILGEQIWTDPSQLPTHVARYASPEQAQGEPVDGRTDVYSLALILVEAVTGSAPFMGDSTVSTLSARVGKLMPVSADLGPMASVLERAGRPEPAERATASQFGRALVGIAERMPRPTPIPILAKGPFADGDAIRRPNDPTGGIVRPPAEPEPVLVARGPARPGDPTAEIVGVSEPAVAASAETSPPDRPEATVPSGDATTERPDRDASGELPIVDPAGPVARRGSAAPAPAPDPSAEAATPAGAVAADALAPVDGGPSDSVDLAGLVERTPVPPPPTDDADGRRKARRAAKRRAKDAGKQGKDAAPPAITSGGSSAPAAWRSGADIDTGPVPVVGAATPAVAVAPKRHRLLGFLFGLVLVAALAALGFAAWALFRTPTHPVPDVSGLTEEQALLAVQDFKWDVETDVTRDDTFDTPGEVVRSSPAAGHDLAEGSPLIIYVSEGAEYRTLANLAGMTVDEATAALEADRLEVGTQTEQYDENVPAGTVISNSADGVTVGEQLLPGTPVNLVVSQGPTPRIVPDLTGRTEEQATGLLDQFSLVLAVGEPVFSDTVPAGQIAVQAPAAQDSLARGGTVTVSVSKGPDLVAVPDLSGMTLPQIREALTAAGLQVGGILGSTQGTFYAASVDGEQVAPGDSVRRGSSVDLIVLTS